MRYEWPWGTSLLVAKAVKLDKPVFYATVILHLFDLWRIKVEEKLSSWTLFKDSLIFWHWSHMIHCHYCKKGYPCSNECICSLSQLARAGDLQCRHGYTWSVHIRPHHDELHLPGRRQLKGMFFMSQCCSQASGWYKVSRDQKKPQQQQQRQTSPSPYWHEGLESFAQSGSHPFMPREFRRF